MVRVVDIKSSSKNLSKSLELYSELMENLTLKDEEFQPERDVVAEERRWRTDNSPMGYLYFKLFNRSQFKKINWSKVAFLSTNSAYNIRSSQIRNAMCFF